MRKRAHRRFAAGLCVVLTLCVVLAGGAEALTSRNTFESLSAAARLESALGLGPGMRVMEREARLEPQTLERLSTFAPRVASIWIDLGLERERRHEFVKAETALLHAARVDRGLLPAWTLANFYFRRSRTEEFWRWASVASARVYDDFRPLLQLCNMLESDPRVVLTKLASNDGRLARAYLDFLIGKGEIPGADVLAKFMAARNEEADRPRLMDWISRELSQGRWEAPLEVWNVLAEPDAGPVLTNAEFRQPPSGQGFDWRVPSVNGVQSSWTPGELVFDFSGTQADDAVLLEQNIPVQEGRLYEIAASGSSLVWDLDGKPGPLRAAKAGLAKVRCVYHRKKGTVPLQGEVHIRKIRLNVH